MASIGHEHLIDIFNNSNYQTWSTCMEIFFHWKEQWNHVNGGTITPVDPTNQIAWDIKDTKARTNLLLCMKNNQLVHVKSFKTSKEISYQIKINF
jgi:hypothetical protein